MAHNYSIYDLVDIFADHAKQFAEKNPKSDFSLCEALLCICKEIQELKEKTVYEE